MKEKLRRSFHWAAVAVNALLRHRGAGLRDTALCHAAGRSSHCSGSGAPEIAWLVIFTCVVAFPLPEMIVIGMNPL